MPHADVLDERESLRKSFLSAVGLHAGVAAALAGAAWVSSQTPTQWGDPNSLGGGAVGITAVERIPLPSRQGPMNPVANDTQNVIPPPKPQPAKQKLPDPEAIALKSRDAKKRRPRRQRPIDRNTRRRKRGQIR
jgi:hypothetical protein